MRIAFKEWAVIVDALGRGGQIIILRKGGISEGRTGFRVEHEKFLLFPTLFHQQRESVSDAAQQRFDGLALTFPPPDRVRLEFGAEVVDWSRLDNLAAARRLDGQHIWRDTVIAERFEWGKEKQIYALAVRVLRLPQPVELAVQPAYGGCKSWIELATDVPFTHARPVLDDVTFADHLIRFRAALNLRSFTGPLTDARA